MTSRCEHPEKQRHASKRAALKARDHLEATEGIDLGLKPYLCDGHWHLGHQHKPLTFAQWDRKMRHRARKGGK